ncbi:hypothetical protein C9374_005044 [Naegleria lovaniensis]|uniref:Uncharacterized protein n=1 Tax=Naegleria lovaniensis TaxID=51637 RepID=A0AA88GNS2_NAELO|nr:uncharacterized protein C9374_005044 [Naegleria lovaniensis]KAG2382464.1 hypothetical protein C9374_005044 [Naegleria lovaniensis]
MTQIRREGPKPRYQNDYAFKHNKASKLTTKILSTPNVGLCKRCHDIIEWKKAYRKYKPLTQPRRCNICQQKTVTLAYHVICNKCAKDNRKCAKCLEPYDEKLAADEKLLEEIKNLDELERKMSHMTLRQQHAIIREAQKMAEQDKLNDADNLEQNGESSSTSKSSSEKKQVEEESDEEYDEDDDFDDDL